MIIFGLVASFSAVFVCLTAVNEHISLGDRGNKQNVERSLAGNRTIWNGDEVDKQTIDRSHDWGINQNISQTKLTAMCHYSVSPNITIFLAI